MITIIAVLCSLSSGDCRDVLVTNSDIENISIGSCLMGPPKLAEWMKQHPADRMAGWKCVIGKPPKGI